MSTINLKNSIWPNPEGPLGAITTEIPDGTSVQWPEGDALVENFVYKDGKLNGVVDTKALVLNQDATTIIPYEYIDAEFESILETTLGADPGERNKYFNIKYGKLPAGFTLLEYLQSTGYQWIKTNLLNDSSTHIQAKFSINSNRLNADGKIFGAGSVALCTLDGYFREYNNKTIKTTADIWTTHCWAGKKGYTCGKLYNTVTKELFESNDLWATWPDGTAEYTYIFTAYGWGSPDGPSYVKLYSFTGKESTNHIKMIPCLDETGAPCMYDLISKTPYYNSGTSDFLYPNAESVITTSSLDDTFYAKLTPTGIRRLYHVPANYKGSKDEFAAENGYKELVEPPMPEEGYWAPQWEETDTQLICEWVEVEPPARELV